MKQYFHVWLGAFVLTTMTVEFFKEVKWTTYPGIGVFALVVTVLVSDSIQIIKHELKED